MESKDKTSISVKAEIAAPLERVWKLWITPDDIVHWSYASDDWHTTSAINDLREGGTFSYRMEAKDGSFGFDFSGVYTTIIVNERIEYELGGRKCRIVFSAEGHKTIVVETFEAENVYSVEQQRSGWQAILDTFKKYAEAR